VRLAGVLGAAGAVGRVERAVGVYLAFEAVEERGACGCGAGGPVGGPRPRLLGGD
jgi:hypothetical protein